MRLANPLRRLRDRLLGTRRPATIRRAKARLGVEALEGRDVPAVVFESTYA